MKQQKIPILLGGREHKDVSVCVWGGASPALLFLELKGDVWCLVTSCLR